VGNFSKLGAPRVNLKMIRVEPNDNVSIKQYQIFVRLGIQVQHPIAPGKINPGSAVIPRASRLIGGAAVPGRLSLAGTEARPTELFSYRRVIQKTNFCHSERSEESLFLSR
jgi:hypothetical protein